MAKQSIADLFDLTGKVAVVTGGALGIGKGIAVRLAEAGAAVMIADMKDGEAEQTVREIRESGGKAEFVHANAANVADAQATIQRVVEVFGRLDILVNNAGIYPFAPALEITEELWDRVLDINLKGTFFFAQAAARQMIKGGAGGRIINIASIDALHRSSDVLAHYDSSKGGVAMLTKALALAFGREHILVNAIAPGGINTPGAAASTAGMNLEALDPSVFTARIPLGRQGEPDDIAKVALFLASDASEYMTGTMLVVDGGYLLS